MTRVGTRHAAAPTEHDPLGRHPGPMSPTDMQAVPGFDAGTRRLLRVVRHLLTPEAGLVGQAVRFVIAGGVVAVIYLTITTVLAKVLGVPFQVALIVGFASGLVVHFTLQRLFVWVHREEFVLPVSRQIGRYLLVAATQYGATAAATASLPSLLHVPTLAVYYVLWVLVALSNFLIFGHGVFHARRDDDLRSDFSP